MSAEITGTWMLNTRSTPCIRALKTPFTQTIREAGLMQPDTFTGIQQVYFGGDMNAAPKPGLHAGERKPTARLLTV